jgi:hypothetical protein
MWQLFAILVMATAPYGIVAASDAVRVTGDETKAWVGKTVVPTARSPGTFMAYTRAKLSFGLLGIAGAARAGKQIIEGNGVENSAPWIAKALFEAAKTRYGVNWGYARAFGGQVH